MSGYIKTCECGNPNFKWEETLPTFCDMFFYLGLCSRCGRRNKYVSPLVPLLMADEGGEYVEMVSIKAWEADVGKPYVHPDFESKPS